jgi:hypothetical protein
MATEYISIALLCTLVGGVICFPVWMLAAKSACMMC